MSTKPETEIPRYGPGGDGLGDDRNVVQRLAAIMGELPAIPKSGRGPSSQGSYPFRKVEDVTTILRSLLAKHGVAFSASAIPYHAITDAGTTKNGMLIQQAELLIEYTFEAPDGSQRKACAFGLATDAGADKAANKAMTAAMKYALTQAFLISDDADDMDGERTERVRDGSGGSEPTDHTFEQEVAIAFTQLEGPIKAKVAKRAKDEQGVTNAVRSGDKAGAVKAIIEEELTALNQGGSSE